MAARLRSGRPTWAAWLGLALLLVNMLAAPLVGYRPLTIAADDSLIICTSDGPARVGADGRPLDGPPRHDHFCAYCLPLASPDGGLALAAVAALPLPGGILAAPPSAIDAAALRPAPQPGGLARAPPARA